jgi:hypothetical protein
LGTVAKDVRLSPGITGIVGDIRFCSSESLWDLNGLSAFPVALGGDHMDIELKYASNFRNIGKVYDSIGERVQELGVFAVKAVATDAIDLYDFGVERLLSGLPIPWPYLGVQGYAVKTVEATGRVLRHIVRRKGLMKLVLQRVERKVGFGEIFSAYDIICLLYDLEKRIRFSDYFRRIRLLFPVGGAMKALREHLQ